MRQTELLLSVSASLLLSVLTSSFARADSPREVAARVSPGVVLLVMEDSNGQPLAMGSGFVIKDGIVATNLHVVEGASRGYAKLADRKDKFNISGTAAIDAARDVVLLAVEAIKAPALTLGDSKQVAVGDEVYAVGNPRGLEGTFSAGIISSIRKVGGDSLLQITAPISPGSSGGPVVNNKGEVIGVAVATFKGGQNLNFAIPSTYVSTLASAVKPAVPLSKANQRAKSPKAKSILEDMGGRNTDGVTAGQFLWKLPGNEFSGHYSFSLRNQLRDPVKNVFCLLVFHDKDGQPVETSVVTFEEVIAPGLAKRVTGQVDGSVKKLTSGDADAPRTKLEYRVLYFDVVTGDEPPEGRGEAVPVEPPAIARKSASPSDKQAATNQDEAEKSIREAETKLAEIVAKLAPAGDGPDLIESNIEGKFSGWEGETIFKLSNGQIWQQVTYAYTYHYDYRPKVLIIKIHGAYKMKVDGVEGTIFVKRLAADNGEIDLYGADGVAAAYIVVGGRELPIYLWSGEAVAYLSGESIYGFNGKHIGWYRNSSVCDHEGKLVATPKDKALVKVKPPEAKGLKKVQPLKGLKELKPLKPLWGIGASDLRPKAFFSRGKE